MLGGIHASMCLDKALQYADATVIGEAESAWANVISDFEAGKMQEVYKGDWLDLQEMPRPRRDLFHPSYMFDFYFCIQARALCSQFSGNSRIRVSSSHWYNF